MEKINDVCHFLIKDHNSCATLKDMKRILFPTVAAADAFIADLQAQNVVRSVSNGNLYRQGTAATPAAPVTTTTTTEVVEGGGTAEDAAAGAAKGTGVGAVVGAVAGIIGTGATIATGGLALPVILGMTAAGAAVGATVGGVGGAAGVDETGEYRYEETETTYQRVHDTYNAGGRAVAVDDNIPVDILENAMRKHGGEYIL